MTGADQRLVASAARNNAEWCDISCRLHGMAGEFRDDAWTSGVRTPVHYPDAVTLRRSVDAAGILTRIDASDGCSIKDSFADLDLAPWGFDLLFEAGWIHHAAGSAVGGTGPPDWKPVCDDTTLSAWETAWGTGATGPRIFRPALLARDDVVVLAAREAEAIVGGAILSLGAGVVGLSNLFVVGADLGNAFAGATAAAGRLFPGMALVGYETGPFLDAAEQAGFERVGRLVVWLKG
jgi:hypothetical protein